MKKMGYLWGIAVVIVLVLQMGAGYLAGDAFDREFAKGKPGIVFWSFTLASGIGILALTEVNAWLKKILLKKQDRGKTQQAGAITYRQRLGQVCRLMNICGFFFFWGWLSGSHALWPHLCGSTVR